jgi:hypothetical protein
MTALQLQFLCGMVVGETANPGDFSSEFELRIAFRKSDLSLLIDIGNAGDPTNDGAVGTPIRNDHNAEKGTFPSLV